MNLGLALGAPGRARTDSSGTVRSGADSLVTCASHWAVGHSVFWNRRGTLLFSLRVEATKRITEPPGGEGRAVQEGSHGTLIF